MSPVLTQARSKSLCSAHHRDPFSAEKPKAVIIMQVCAIRNMNSVALRSACELHRPSGRNLSDKSVAMFEGSKVSGSQRDGSPLHLISVFYSAPAILHSRSSCMILTRVSGPRSRRSTPQKIW
jgi:hypothetical protein